MTKEEFLSIINNELERLQEEEKRLVGKVDIIEKLGDSPKGLEEAEYQLITIRDKYNMIKDLVGIESIARYETMSEVEIEEYRQEEMNKIRDKIALLTSEYNKYKDKVIKLQDKLNKLIDGGSSSDEAIRNIRVLKDQINENEEYKTSMNENRSKEEKALQELKECTCEDIRKKLIAEVPNKSNIDELINLDKYNIGSFGEDYEKASELVNLRRKYVYLDAKYRNFEMSRQYHVSLLPNMVANAVRKVCDKTNSGDDYITVNDPKELLRTISTFRKYLENTIPDFEDFKMDFLKPLVGKGDIRNISTYDIDLSYLSQFSHGSDLTKLSDYISKRDNLNKKIVKTSKTIDDITDLNEKIRGLAYSMYRSLISHYTSEFFSFGDFLKESDFKKYGPTVLNFNDEYEIEKALKDTRNTIIEATERLDSIEKEAKNHLEEYNKQKSSLEAQLEETIERIKELTGKEEVNVNTYDANIDKVASEVSIGYQADLLKQIREEAQKQSDLKEADIRHITLEKLYELRKEIHEEKEIEEEQVEDKVVEPVEAEDVEVDEEELEEQKTM